MSGGAELMKLDRVMFDSYGLRLPMDPMKAREEMCADRQMNDQVPYNHHSIDDILGYRRIQDTMKGKTSHVNIS